MLRLIDQERAFPFVGEQANAQGVMKALGYCVKKTPFTLLLEAQLPSKIAPGASLTHGLVCSLLSGGEVVHQRGQDAPVIITARTLDCTPGTLRWSVETRIQTLSSQQEAPDLSLRFSLRFGRGSGTSSFSFASHFSHHFMLDDLIHTISIPFQCYSKLDQIRRIAKKFEPCDSTTAAPAEPVRANKKRLRADDIVESMEQLNKRQRLTYESQMRIEYDDLFLFQQTTPDPFAVLMALQVYGTSITRSPTHPFGRNGCFHSSLP